MRRILVQHQRWKPLPLHHLRKMRPGRRLLKGGRKKNKKRLILLFFFNLFPIIIPQLRIAAGRQNDESVEALVDSFIYSDIQDTECLR